MGSFVGSPHAQTERLPSPEKVPLSDSRQSLYTSVDKFTLSYEQFKKIYKEFTVWDELTTQIFRDMGIFRELESAEPKFQYVTADSFCDYDEPDTSFRVHQDEGMGLGKLKAVN